MNDFARTQLMKYGWSEGKGLGKCENGIVQALKPKLKFDTAGIGHKYDEYDNWWWENAYNKAANNITVESRTNKVSISVSRTDETENVPRNRSKDRKLKSSMQYGNFLKSSVLLNGNLIEDNTVTRKTEDVITPHRAPLTDEELFKICGGRTAHKGARHGLTLNGKLRRIAQQEEALLNTNSSFKAPEKLERSNTTTNNNDDDDNNNNSNNNNNNNNNTSDDEYEHITANERIVLSMASVEQVAEKKISKSAKRRTKRCMNDLSHKLNILCNLGENGERSMIKGAEEESKRKSNDERKKKKRRNSDSCAKTEIEVPFSSNRKLEEAIIKKNSEVLCTSYTDTDTYTNAKTSTKKRKKLKNKKKQDKFNEHPAKKFKKFDENHLDSLPVEDTEDFLKCKLQRKHVFKEPTESDEIKDSTCSTDSPHSYTKQTSDKLNKKLRKKKRTKRLRRERIGLEKLAACLEAVHFNIEESNVEQCNKRKLKQASEKLIDTNTVTDKTESLKKQKSKKK